MKFTQIKETCLYFEDLEASRHFYHDQLNLPIVSYVRQKHIFFRAGNSMLLCFNPQDSKSKQSPPGHYASGKYHFALEVAREDYENQKAEFINKGLNIIDQVIWKTGQESFYFEDPIGNVVEIVPEGIWD
ncbi:MAG: VOC family protein [Cyclobacteriaceae bacterium]